MSENQKGFTLVELLVVLALSGIVTAAVYKSFTAQQQVYVAQDQVAGMQQDVRAALEIMIKELRMAGYDPRGTAGAGITAATNSMIQFTADHNRNGVLVSPGPPPDNDAHENITFSLRPESDPDGDGIATVFPSELRRSSWGVPSPLAENVEILNFVYLDAENKVIATPVSSDDLARIRSIQVFIVVRSDQEDRHYRDTSTYTNLLYDRDHTEAQALKWGPPNDGYRRRVLKTTVKCRNAGI